MNTRDNIQAELQRMSMEIVRLANEKASQDEYVRFLESENGRKKSDAKAANLQLLLDETTLALSESNSKVTVLTEKLEPLMLAAIIGQLPVLYRANVLTGG